MLSFDDLTREQIEMLRNIFFDDICNPNDFPNLDAVTDAILETHFRHTVFDRSDFAIGGPYFHDIS